MKQDLMDLLRADAGVAAVASARVWWAERPQGSALPAAVLHVINGSDDYHLRGRIDLVETRVQVDCWGAAYLGADSLAQAVRDVLSGFHGMMGTTRFRGVFLDGDRDLSEAAGGAEPRLFRIALDFKVNHSTGA